MPQANRKPIAHKGRGPQPPAAAHLHPSQPRSAPQMQYRPQHQQAHHNNSNPRLVQLQHQQNVQRGQIAHHNAQINQHHAALQHQSAEQQRHNAAQQKQFAKQNVQNQKQMAKQNAAMQKQMTKQNAAMQKQNRHMNHELQAMKHQQQHGGAGKKVLAGAAVGAAAGVGGAMLYEGYSEQTYIHEETIRNEQQGLQDQDTGDFYRDDYDRDDSYDNYDYDYNNTNNNNNTNDDDQNWSQQVDNSQGSGYWNQQSTGDPVQSSGGNGNDSECCGDCCSGCDNCCDWGCCGSDSKDDDNSCCCCC